MHKFQMYHALLLFITIFCAGCSTTHALKGHEKTGLKPKHSASKRTPLTSEERIRLLQAAKGALGRSNLKVNNRSYRSDCSGTIRGIFTKARVGLGGIIKNESENDVKAIYRYVQKYGKIVKAHPQEGDLVFFHNTYDRSRSGHMKDALTHIGIVEKVEGSTIHFIHHLGQSIIRSRMDLSFPHETFHPTTKVRINHMLRRAQGTQRAYTAAELFAGFGHL